jgi:hypothetical protein
MSQSARPRQTACGEAVIGPSGVPPGSIHTALPPEAVVRQRNCLRPAPRAWGLHAHHAVGTDDEQRVGGQPVAATPTWRRGVRR